MNFLSSQGTDRVGTLNLVAGSTRSTTTPVSAPQGDGAPATRNVRDIVMAPKGHFRAHRQQPVHDVAP